jgi:hypothetical protein
LTTIIPYFTLGEGWPVSFDNDNILVDAQNCELQEQLAVMTKRKSRKRKRLQTGGTVEYGEGALQATASLQPAKKACGGSGVRHCSNCGEVGHNIRSCTKAASESSESEASTQFIMSDTE